ncbi:MAG: hypothetical protein ABI574_15880, partial [Burkholderiales bacterium]
MAKRHTSFMRGTDSAHTLWKTPVHRPGARARDAVIEGNPMALQSRASTHTGKVAGKTTTARVT